MCNVALRPGRNVLLKFVLSSSFSSIRNCCTWEMKCLIYLFSAGSVSLDLWRSQKATRPNTPFHLRGIRRRPAFTLTLWIFQRFVWGVMLLHLCANGYGVKFHVWKLILWTLNIFKVSVNRYNLSMQVPSLTLSSFSIRSDDGQVRTYI